MYICIPIIIGFERLSAKRPYWLWCIFAKLHGISLNNIITFETAEIVADPFICKYRELTDATYLRVIIRIHLPITLVFSCKRQRNYASNFDNFSRTLSGKPLIRNNCFCKIKRTYIRAADDDLQ